MPKISPHWLRHAHASHALDHGAPIHLVQATLGHTSVATTSAYLHARPGDSSARFLNLSPQFTQSTLPLQRTGVMDVMTAVPTARGDSIMTSTTEETKTSKTAPVMPQKPAVAPVKAKSGKNATSAKKAPKAAKGAKAAKPLAGTRE